MLESSSWQDAPETVVDALLEALDHQLARYAERSTLTSFERTELERERKALQRQRALWQTRAAPSEQPSPLPFEESAALRGARSTRDLSDLQPWYALMARLVQQTLEKDWLQGTATPHVEVGRADAEGATDAILLKASVSVDLFVKVHDQDCTKEARGFKLLSTSGSQRFAEHLIGPFAADGDSFPGNGLLWLTPSPAMGCSG